MKLTKKLIMGVSTILIAFTGSTLAIPNPINWAKCKYCNARFNKCAKDENFYLDCRAKCPQSEGKPDPIQQCSNAHFLQQAHSAPTASRPENSVRSLLDQYSCKEKQLMIALDEKFAPELGRRPYSEKERQFILGHCSSALVPHSEESEQSTSGSAMTRDEALKFMGLLPTATPEQVRSKYRKMALTMHTDKGGSAEDFQKLHEAYQILQAEEGKNASSSSIPALMPSEESQHPSAAPSTGDEESDIPPPPPAPSLKPEEASVLPADQEGSHQGENDALLAAIRKGKQLKKVQTKESTTPGLGKVKPSQSSAPQAVNVNQSSKESATSSAPSGQSIDLAAALQAKQKALKKAPIPGSQKDPTSQGGMLDSPLFKKQRDKNYNGDVD